MYKFKNDTVILIGDTHSTSSTHDLLLRIPDGNDVFHCGDGGWGFGNVSYALDNAKSWLDKINKLCQKLNIVLYHQIGNHDNPAVWELPPSWSNVILVKSGDIGIFPNGKKVIFIGGGVSVDRCGRTEGIDYWKDEVTPILKNIEKCDIMFSHDCPEYFNHSTTSLGERFQWAIDRDPLLVDDCNCQRINMNNIVKDSGVNTIISGHYHNTIRDEVNGIYYRCLDINELYEFDSTLDYRLV